MKRMLFLFPLLLAANSYAQKTVVDSDTIRKDALNVFMSADNYIKNEITFINYVRDLKEADLYIIMTPQSTGGGRSYTYFLVGQNNYSGMNDTLIVNTSVDDTQDVIRIKQIKALKMGLMRYILKTPLAGYFDIRFTQPIKETVSTDKWDSWVFSLSLYAYINGEKSYKSTMFDGGISARRITEKNKFMFNYSYGRSISKYDIMGEIYTSLSKSQYAELMYVKGINDHWSIGGDVSSRSSVYSNIDFAITLMPAVEYNIYPYRESTRRQLTFMYGIGSNYCNYSDTTIYDKTRETLGQHAFSASYRVIEKWGSASVSFYYSNYLHDWSKNNLSLYSSLSLRIVKGLSFSLGGRFSLVHDQLALIRGGASYEEMLLRRKEIATQFTYYSNFSISYTFGSIYNNAVNPRFSGSIF